MRDAAIEVLNAVEAQMVPLAERRLDTTKAHGLDSVHMKLGELRKAAGQFLGEKMDPTEGSMATAFCRECVDDGLAAIIRNLIKRDDRVLRLVGNDILPGGAFNVEASDEESGESVDHAVRVPVPVGISGRIRNLYLLELDLQGRLGTFLYSSKTEGTA